MEILARYLDRYPTPMAGYMALQCALMRRFVARGGTREDFCARIAPAFRCRFEARFFGVGAGRRRP
jgi:hypothetical protein